jgi:RhoGEF domain.
MLLPMLSIYQEYVRNHHYSLQVLTECKQTAPFAALLARLENKPACQGRSLETFLTYPMHQVCTPTVPLSVLVQFTFNSSALISVTNFTGEILTEKLSNPQVFRQFAPLPRLFRRFRKIAKSDR